MIRSDGPNKNKTPVDSAKSDAIPSWYMSNDLVLIQLLAIVPPLFRADLAAKHRVPTYQVTSQQNAKMYKLVIINYY